MNKKNQDLAERAIDAAVRDMRTGSTKVDLAFMAHKHNEALIEKAIELGLNPKEVLDNVMTALVVCCLRFAADGCERELIYGVSQKLAAMANHVETMKSLDGEELRRRLKKIAH